MIGGSALSIIASGLLNLALLGALLGGAAYAVVWFGFFHEAALILLTIIAWKR